MTNKLLPTFLCAALLSAATMLCLHHRESLGHVHGANADIGIKDGRVTNSVNRRTMAEQSNHVCRGCDHSPRSTREPAQAKPQETVRMENLEPFDEWLNRYKAGGADLNEGMRLAREREPVMRRLMKQDPELAYQRATAESVWGSLPQEMQPFVERRFREVGTYEASYDCFSDEVYRNLTTRNFSTCDASVTEEFLSINRFEGGMRGVTLGNDAALVAMEDGGLVDGPGPVVENAPSTGNLKLLWLSIKYSDQTGYPDGVSSVTTSLNSVVSNYAAWSYGRVSMTFEILEVSIPSASGIADSQVRTEADAAAIALGKNPSNYNITLYRTTNLGNYSWIPSSIVHLKRNNTSTTVHEIGHAIGLHHANWWDPNAGEPAWGAGVNRLYAEDWDAMANSPRGDFNASEKKKLGWLDSGTDYVDDVSSGTYRIYPYDSHNGGFSNAGVNGAYYGVTVFKDTKAVNGEYGDRRYFLSMRNQPEKAANSYNGWYANGLLLHWEPWTYNGSSGYNSNGPYGTTLIDAHVDSNAGSALGTSEQYDAPIMVGETYVDNDPGNRDGDIYITVLSKTDPDGTPRNGDEYLDVKVVIGDQTGNQAPTVSLSASALAVLPNQSVTLTASGSDPDDTTLAYLWDFGNGTNEAARKAMPLNGATTQTFSWATEGVYTVSVTVSDCRGGTHTDTVDILVASTELLITESNGDTAVTESGVTDTYEVTLNQAPTQNVTVALTTNGEVTVSPTSLTFTPTDWADPQVVTVTAVDDSDHELAHTGTITHTSSSSYAPWNGLVKTLTLDITDNDNTAPTVNAGANQTVTLSGVAPTTGWSYSAWTGDADSGISDAYVYTAAHCFGDNQASVTINGVTIISNFNSSGTGWSLGGSVSPWQGDDTVAVTGSSEQLAQEFVYNGKPRTVALDGLTVGKYYVVTFYSSGWEASGRVQTFSADGGVIADMNIDQDAYGKNQGIKISCTYQATATTQGFTITNLTSNSFHMYALTNREENAASATAVLSASALDGDGDAMTHVWSTFAGPASATFNNGGVINTTADFTTAGVYILRLTSTDGNDSGFDDVVITVSDGGAPLVTTAHSVPHAWLAAMSSNWSADYEAADQADHDGDGIPTWKEYWSGTDPRNPDSIFKIDSISIDGSDVVLEWSHSAIEGTIPDITVETSTNLGAASWGAAATHSPVNGVNIKRITKPTGNCFYRLNASAAP